MLDVKSTMNKLVEQFEKESKARFMWENKYWDKDKDCDKLLERCQKAEKRNKLLIKLIFRIGATNISRDQIKEMIDIQLKTEDDRN